MRSIRFRISSKRLASIRPRSRVSLERGKLRTYRPDQSNICLTVYPQGLSRTKMGLDEELTRLFDPASKRSNYLMIQDELCDLVLDERRKLGASLSGVVEQVKEDDSNASMVHQVAHLDSKPDFLYIFSSSKGSLGTR